MGRDRGRLERKWMVRYREEDTTARWAYVDFFDREAVDLFCAELIRVGVTRFSIWKREVEFDGR